MIELGLISELGGNYSNIAYNIWDVVIKSVLTSQCIAYMLLYDCLQRFLTKTEMPHTCYML